MNPLPVMRSARVLVADDHPVNRALVTRQLQSLGFSVDCAVDGAGALRLWQAEVHAVVIADCAMPGMDGYTLARRIREIEPGLGRGRTLIVACTAGSGDDVQAACERAGMDDCIIKPCSARALERMLVRWGALPCLVEPAPSVRPAAASGESAPVDLALLQEGYGADAQVLGAMLRDFAEINASDARALRSAIDEADSKGLAHHAHRILGAARMVGAAGLARVAAHIETLAFSRDWRRIEAAMTTLHHELGRIERFISGFVRSA